MKISRALVVWLGMVVIAILNAGLRNALLTPLLGEQAGHVAGTVTGCIAFLFFMKLTLPWTGFQGTRALVFLGVLWLVLTVAFEFLAGHFLFDNTWAGLLADYNLARGRVWVAVLLVVLFGPLLIGRLLESGRRRGRTDRGSGRDGTARDRHDGPGAVG